LDPSRLFDSLAGLCPGTSTAAEAVAAFGAATTLEGSDRGLFLRFPTHGVLVFIAGADRDAADPVLDEVTIEPPCGLRLPCDVFLGQPRDQALTIVRRCYTVTDEYDDAIYVRPCSRADLLASVEFRDEPGVVGIELMRIAPAATAG
jgi:hypothetical protein